MILSGPLGPKFMADACVASEKVGDGGSDGDLCIEPKTRARRERGRLGAMMDVSGFSLVIFSFHSMRNCTCHCIYINLYSSPRRPGMH